jgi:hypothetical protein
MGEIVVGWLSGSDGEIGGLVFDPGRLLVFFDCADDEVECIIGRVYSLDIGPRFGEEGWGR